MPDGPDGEALAVNSAPILPVMPAESISFNVKVLEFVSSNNPLTYNLVIKFVPSL